MGVVVLDHDGGEMTLRCLRSVLATDWPADALNVVLVVNGSSDAMAARVGTELGVSVVVTGRNLGFAGGCNVGIEAVGAVDHVALLNNDATVAPDWLDPLVAVLQDDPSIGAACPKILFADSFFEVSLRSAAADRGVADHRAVGVAVSGARVDGADAWRTLQFVRGFWGVEHQAGDAAPYQWTDGDGFLRVASGAGGPTPTCRLRLSAPERRLVVVESGSRRLELTVGPEPAWFDVALEGPPVDVVNNVGSVLLEGGYGADRGFLERDEGQFEMAEEVFAWCGAGVLLAGRYLDAVGTFEPRFFLYYEDFDLSWRGRAQGWRYVYVPGPPVRHVHSASAVEGSRLHHHYSERNRLLTLTRNAPARLALGAVVRHVLVTASYARRDVVHPLLHRRPPSWETVRRRSGALASYLANLPVALLQRPRLRRRQRVPDTELLGWAR